MTVATEDGKTFYVSSNMVRAFTSALEGKQYRVILHALPRFCFYVEAESADKAQSLVLSVVRKERRVSCTGATIQAVSTQ
jgi:hypothetical protein